MQQLPNLKNVSDVQKIIDDTVILLLTIKGKNDFSLLKTQEIDEVIKHLQDCSRSLPEISKQHNQRFSKELLSVIEKAIHLCGELFHL